MNLITSKLQMTSLEIAELVNKRHDNVKRTIETLAKSEIIQLPQSEKVENKQSNSPNRFTDVYVFQEEQGKRNSIIVVAQLCPEFTARLVDRWQQLEQEKLLGFNPNDEIAVLENLLKEKKHNKELTHKIAEMKPDVAALERIAKSDGAMCVTDAAKQLQLRPKDLFNFLSENKWLYRRLGSPWIGYQDKIQQGLIEHKVTTITHTNGINETKTQVRITPKGIAKLAKLLSLGIAA
ncbi:DNA-binding protein [Arsenophonus sp. ENCA]|uniref:phage antirepressor KilAC domain-containing protein n=1 Tax=Arsenophonus sp. ENCA TaxID=1987579 RepID=UPI000BD8608E|nr:phage antirepressor KilAC domain-containing protein [Arsenophonus sp. ENCA]PAV02173.1 DNA-binding protein [Arsenophonus sp. ENCA]